MSQTAAPSQIATRSALVSPCTPRWVARTHPGPFLSPRGYLALMSGCIPAIICLSLGHESGLCWVMERRWVAPHSGTAPRTDVGREPRTLRRRVLEPRSRSGLCRLRRVHQPF